MQAKDTLPLTHIQDQAAPLIIQAYYEFNHLKQLYRQGWLLRGIPPERCETVAEHTFGVALLTLFLADALDLPFDRAKAVRMALLHDLGEIYAGDWTPVDGITSQSKHDLEAQSIERVLGKLPNGPAYVALWQDYEQGISPEAVFVHQIDRLEMALQASIYEHQSLTEISLAEFFDTTDRALSMPELRAILEQLFALRPGPDTDEHRKHR